MLMLSYAPLPFSAELGDGQLAESYLHSTSRQGALPVYCESRCVLKKFRALP